MSGREIEFGIRITADGKVLVTEAGRAEKALGNIGKTAQEVERHTGALTASFARMGHAAAAAFSVRELAQASDAFATLNARLALVSAGATSAAVAYQRVYEIAQATRQGVAEVGLVYERFGRQADALGLSQKQLGDITTSVSQAMVISGASAESSRAALMQLGQGIASGTLRGEELNSVLEQAPRLAQALADGLGVPIGKLRELGETGQLTADKLVGALAREAPKLAAEFERLPVTVAGALTNIRNAWTDTVGSFEQSTGAFRVVAGGLQGVATHMDGLVAVGGTLAAVMAGRLVGAGAAAVGTLAAQAAAAMSAKISYDALGVAIGATSGRAALAGAAVGALGGPIGIVTTALTLGATAWAIWGDAAKNASDKARDALRAAQDEAARLGRKDTELVREKFDAAAARYYENMSDPKARAEWMQLGDLLRELETRDKNLAAQMKSSAASALDAWNNSKLGTKAEEQARKLAELAKEYHAAMQEAVSLGKSEKERNDIVAQYTARAAELQKVGAGRTAQAKTEADAYKAVQQAALAAMGAGRSAAEVMRQLHAEDAAAAREAAEAVQIHAEYVKANLDPLDRQAEALERTVEFYGMTEGAIQRTIAARIEEARAVAAANGALPQHLAYLDAEIEKRQRLAAAADSKEALDANKGAVDEMERDWRRMHEQLSQSLTDELMRGGQNAGELLKNYFKTLVLRPIIQGTVDAGLAAIGLGGRSSSGGSAVDSASSLWGAYSGGTTAAWSSFATSGIGEAIGLSSATSLGTSSIVMESALSQSIGAALPWVGGALAVASLLGALDSGGGPKTEGGLVSTVGGGFGELSSTGQKFFTGDGSDDLVRGYLAPLTADLAKLAAELGGDASGLELGLGFNSDPAGTAGDSVGGGVYRNGEGLYFHAFGGYARGSYAQEMATESKRVMLAALEAIDLNDLADAYLDTLDIAALTDEMASQSLALVATTDDIIAAFENVGFSAADVTLDLINAMGGFDAAGQAVAAMSQQLDAIAQAAANSTAAFSNSIRSIELSVLDDPGKYAYLDAEAARYKDVLASLSDPALIAEYAGRLNDTIMQAWGTLDGTQQQAKADEFITLLREADELALSRYDVAKENVTEQAKEIAAAVKAAVAEAMEENVAASNAVVTAVNNGIDAHVSINLTIDQIRGAEVAGWSST